MNVFQPILDSRRIKHLSDYLYLDKRLDEYDRMNASVSTTKIRIAYISSFTAKGIKESLRVQLSQLGVASEIIVGGYNQYTQEILDSQSALYKSAPNVIVLFIETRTLFGDRYYHPYQQSLVERKAWAEARYRELVQLLDTLQERSSAKIIIHNFEVPTHSSMGVLESKQEFGFHESVEWLNHQLRSYVRERPSVYLFDYNGFASVLGKRELHDPKMYYLADFRLALEHIPALTAEYVGYIRPLVGLTKKCIVLDCDNTLWGGVIGEDGIGGIRLGPTPEGRAYLEFQQYLLSLHHRGVILAINSKNNVDDVLKVLREHPSMMLREDHFAAMRINWDDKASNIRSLADEINIGTESMIFVDDDPLNRSIVRELLPEVTVIDLPADPSEYLESLSILKEFNALVLTDEDYAKGKMYAEEKKRKTLEHTSQDFNQFLEKLSIVVTIEMANERTIPRIAQLTQKTNQWNMTTRRYTSEAISGLLRSNQWFIASIQTQDAFGDNGIVGVVMVDISQEPWRIDTLLMSCRVIGRRIEETILAWVIERAMNAGVKKVVGEFIKSSKNTPAEGFYKRQGFIRLHDLDAIEQWEYDVAHPYPFPDFIKFQYVQ